MQRQLKFRYWNSVSNMMVNDPVLPTKAWSLEEYFSDRGWIWMQATGLKDKNGAEICEGDVLMRNMHHALTENVAVVWDEKIGCWLAGSHPFTGGNGTYEVIGNVHENPELLANVKEA